jgi:hypothetical protein
MLASKNIVALILCTGLLWGCSKKNPVASNNNQQPVSATFEIKYWWIGAAYQNGDGDSVSNGQVGFHFTSSKDNDTCFLDSLIVNFPYDSAPGGRMDTAYVVGGLPHIQVGWIIVATNPDSNKTWDGEFYPWFYFMKARYSRQGRQGFWPPQHGIFYVKVFGFWDGSYHYSSRYTFNG